MDIDLNYIGQLDREEMQRERLEIVKAIEQITKALGYKVQRSADDYALNEWFLTYQNHVGSFDQIQIEINFLMRACALAPQLRQAMPIGDEPACEFPVLAIEELFAGKIRAMIDRQHPRDLYDLFRFRKANLSYDSEVMRTRRVPHLGESDVFIVSVVLQNEQVTWYQWGSEFRFPPPAPLSQFSFGLDFTPHTNAYNTAFLPLEH